MQLIAAGFGIASSVIPSVTDQLAMTRLPRSSYALLSSLLPVTAVCMGLVVLGQIPTLSEVLGILLIVVGVALRRDTEAR